MFGFRCAPEKILAALGQLAKYRYLWPNDLICWTWVNAKLLARLSFFYLSEVFAVVTPFRENPTDVRISTILWRSRRKQRKLGWQHFSFRRRISRAGHGVTAINRRSFLLSQRKPEMTSSSRLKLRPLCCGHDTTSCQHKEDPQFHARNEEQQVNTHDLSLLDISSRLHNAPKRQTQSGTMSFLSVL